MPKDTTPARPTSTRGVKASTAATTGSKARASRPGSCSMTTSSGQRPCASLRRRPITTPSWRAASEQAITRLAATTATGSEAGGPRPPPASPGTTRPESGCRPPSTSGGGRGARLVAAGPLVRRMRPRHHGGQEATVGPAAPGRRPPGRSRSPPPIGPGGSHARARGPASPSGATDRKRSAASGQAPLTTRTTPRSRTRAANRRASDDRIPRGGRRRIRSTASISAAVTSGHCAPGWGTRAKRSRAMPSPAAATIPNAGQPTAAHHDSPCDAATPTARASEPPSPPARPTPAPPV